ncbi:MAG: GDP-L-fucose synthase family protein [Candidatus Sifarchaeia archaeon]|jgi:GDP-L-fucose synthase
MKKDSTIFIAGARGLVGSAITRKLKTEGYNNLLTPTSKEVDLTNDDATSAFFDCYKPEYVFMAAAKVGGILANSTYPVEFLFHNLRIQENVFKKSRQCGSKVLFLGSSCIYPKLAPQPIKEEYLLTGALEESNKAYAIAKIAGITGCQAYHKQYGSNFICAMPTNLYGPEDNFDLQNSHVLPALIRKFHEALPNSPVTLWGTGTPRREFLHVDDLASACITLMKHRNNPDPINVGTGEDIAIADLAKIIQEVVGHKGEIVWDSSKPDGTPRKLLDVSKIMNYGWRPKIALREGIISAYDWYKMKYT